MALQEFVPKAALMTTKNALICHSEADTSLACKKERCINPRNDKLKNWEQIPEEPV
jgi:hypothetical protein